MSDIKMHPALEKTPRATQAKEDKERRVQKTLRYLDDHPAITKGELVRHLMETEGVTKAVAYQIIKAAREFLTKEAPK